MRCGRPTGTPLHERTAVAQITIFDSSLKIFLSFREEEKPKKKPNLFWSSSSQILCRVFLTVRNVSVLSCHLPHFSFWKKIDNRFLSLSIGPACQSGNLIAEGNLFFSLSPSLLLLNSSFFFTYYTYIFFSFLPWVSVNFERKKSRNYRHSSACVEKMDFFTEAAWSARHDHRPMKWQPASNGCLNFCVHHSRQQP